MSAGLAELADASDSARCWRTWLFSFGYPGVACQRESPLIKGLFSSVHVYFLGGIQPCGSPEFSTRHSESRKGDCNPYIPQWLQTRLFRSSPFLTRFESHPLRHSFIAFANHVF